MTNGINESGKVDRRTRKTKRAIKSALMDLASKNDISKITITDVSDLADINRKTFYAYYNDVYAVIDELEDDLLKTFLTLIDELDIDKFVLSPYPLLKELTNLINEDIDFYGQLLSANSAGAILEKIKAVIKEKLLQILESKSSIDPVLLNYTIEYSLSGLTAVYREWFNSNRKITLEELSQHISLITSNGFKNVTA